MGSLRRVTSHDYVNGVGSLLLVALCGEYIFLSHIKCCIYKMDVWNVAIGNGCRSFSSFNSDGLCVWFDWTWMAKENFAVSFPKIVET